MEVFVVDEALDDVDDVEAAAAADPDEEEAEEATAAALPLELLEELPTQLVSLPD